MKIKKEPSEIWREYQRGITYNQNINLYARVEKNNDFYNGEQWKGLNAPDLIKPVYNFIKEAVNLYRSTLASDKIGFDIKTINPVNPPTEENVNSGIITDDKIPQILKNSVEEVFENAKIRFLNRKAIGNCAIDGDTCMYFYFDPDEETGFDYTGQIKAEVIDNTNVLFGNPSTEEVEVQPYIIIAYRKLVCDVRDEAEENGLPVDSIQADDETLYMNSNYDFDNSYVTVLLKMWKEDKTVHIKKVTKNAVVKDEFDTELKRYPLCYMPWESRKNSYHGVSPITAIIPNQIYVNKEYAMAMEYTQKMAFPKLLYDRTKIPEGIRNDIGKAIAVTGNPQEAFFASFQGADMSSQVMQLIESTISKTKEHMGAYDAALGNVNPDNTSAIIATQQAAAAPLDIQRMNFYNFVENYIRIIIDFMRINYGKRWITIDDVPIEFDFSSISKYAYNLNVEIGKSNYWSEVTEAQTIDSLIQMQVFPNAEMILEAIPEDNLRTKPKLQKMLREYNEKQAMLQQQAMTEQQAQIQPFKQNVQGGNELSSNQIDDTARAIAELPPDEQAEVLQNLGVTSQDKRRIENAM